MIRRYARVTERPDDFQVDLSADIFRSAVFLGLGRDHHGFRFRDESDGGNHGTLTGYTGAGNTPADRWGRAMGRASLTYNGSSDYVSGSVSNVGITIDFSLSVWIKASANAEVDGRVIAKRALNVGYELYVMSATGYPGVFVGTDVNYSVLVSSVNVLTGTWRHIGVVRRGTALTIYVDGIGYTSSVYTGSVANSSALMLGRYNATAVRWLNGSEADPCIWSRALSPVEIALFADPAWSVMLGGAIYTRPRRAFVGQAGGGVTAKPWLYARRRSQVVGVFQ